ncbi:MAG: four helix bundle protein [Pyrinomonadaceae bacterium]
MFAQKFEDVGIWKKSHAFVLKSYRLTENFPKSELFGLTSQLLRAAVSVPANFAEGFKKISKAGKLRFYNIAQGSLEECRYYLILTQDLSYGEVKELKVNAEKISKMLDSYMRKIRNDN